MEGRGNKGLFSRRSSSNRSYYKSLVIGDEETDIELQNRSTTLSRSSGDSSSVFEDSHPEAGDHGRSDKRVLDGRHVQSSRPTGAGESRIPSDSGRDEVDMPVRSSKHVKNLGLELDEVDMPVTRTSSKHVHSPNKDDVDMAIESSKHVVKGFKRRSSEMRDVVYEFNWFDILIGIGSIVVYFVDVVTDIKLAVDYFLDSQWFYGGVTTGLIFGPSLVTCCFGLHWYSIDYRSEKETINEYKKKGLPIKHRTPTLVWFFRFFFTALLFGPVFRYVVQLLGLNFIKHSPKMIEDLGMKQSD